MLRRRGRLLGRAGGQGGSDGRLGVARLDDKALLTEAGADLVVTTLDDVTIDALGEGRLERRRMRVAK